jgi:hypothetical protein
MIYSPDACSITLFSIRLPLAPAPSNLIPLHWFTPSAHVNVTPVAVNVPETSMDAPALSFTVTPDSIVNVTVEGIVTLSFAI